MVVGICSFSSLRRNIGYTDFGTTSFMRGQRRNDKSKGRWNLVKKREAWNNCDRRVCLAVVTVSCHDLKSVRKALSLSVHSFVHRFYGPLLVMVTSILVQW